MNKIIAAFLMLLLTACGSDDAGNNESRVLPQGARILGLDVSQTGSISYASAYDQAMLLGVREVSVPLDWVLLEPTAGNYANSTPAIIDAFYPFYAGDLTLVLRPLDTAGPRLPNDLAGLPYDDPAVIAAFENFLTNLHDQLGTVNASGKLKWIHVGNEIDAYLGSDASRWSQWEIFFLAARAKIKSLWGNNVIVSSIISSAALNDPATRTPYLSFLANLDSAALTYYPLDSDFTVRATSTIAADFDFITATITGKPIIFQECGYPSSMVNNSSEVQQADFVSAVFDAWDTHFDRIPVIDFTWQYDASVATVDQWVIDYGMSGQANENEFKYYLLSLGMNNNDGTEKLSWQRLNDELLARAWLQ